MACCYFPPCQEGSLGWRGGRLLPERREKAELQHRPQALEPRARREERQQPLSRSQAPRESARQGRAADAQVSVAAPHCRPAALVSLSPCVVASASEKQRALHRARHASRARRGSSSCVLHWATRSPLPPLEVMQRRRKEQRQLSLARSSLPHLIQALPVSMVLARVSDPAVVVVVAAPMVRAHRPKPAATKRRSEVAVAPHLRRTNHRDVCVIQLPLRHPADQDLPRIPNSPSPATHDVVS